MTVVKDSRYRQTVTAWLKAKKNYDLILKFNFKIKYVFLNATVANKLLKIHHRLWRCLQKFYHITFEIVMSKNITLLTCVKCA